MLIPKTLGKGNVCQELDTLAPAWYTQDLGSHDQVLTGKLNCNVLAYSATFASSLNMLALNLPFQKICSKLTLSTSLVSFLYLAF